jgi:hypothetical protein
LSLVLEYNKAEHVYFLPIEVTILSIIL